MAASEFRNFPFEDDGSPLRFDADRSRDVAFLFLGDYLADLDEVTSRYQGGDVTEGRRGSETTYRGYFLPASGND